MPIAHPTADEIAAARAALAALDPALAKVDAATPVFPWRSQPGGLPGLLRLIVGQQVSTASAAAIWARVEARFPDPVPAVIAAASEAELLALGLSRPKARYFRELAAALADGPLELAGLDDAAAIARLTALKGIGRWTAEVHLLFSEGRRDLFPVGDLALREAIRLADGAALRPTEAEAAARAAAWSPHRGVAAHLLWRWCGLLRAREAAPVASVT